MQKALCQVVIVPHNLTNKFQSLDITLNKPAKSFISNKYNEWFPSRFHSNLRKVYRLQMLKYLLVLSSLSVLSYHAKWILELYNHLCLQNKIILNGFKATSITDAVGSANTVLERIENPFSEQQIWTTIYVLYLLYQEFDLKLLFCCLVTKNKMFVSSYNHILLQFMNYNMYLQINLLIHFLYNILYNFLYYYF